MTLAAAFADFGPKKKDQRRYDLTRALQIEREQWRRQCRQHLESWAIQALSPEGQYPARHHRLLCERLEAVSRGEVSRLMVLMPPGSAKSTYVSRIFLSWWFVHHPMTSVIAASNNSDLAQTFGRRARNLVQREQTTLGYSLQEDSRSAGRWETSNGSEYYAAGINGGQGTTITGRRLDLGIIDDPVRTKAEAQNESTQAKIWDWYRTEFYTRMKPNGRIILVMTRWSERDLGGMLLDEMSLGGDQWEVLRLPAIAEDPRLSTEENPIPPDPLGRAPGEALWPEWEGLEALMQKRQTVGEVDWAALYQQSPKPPQGTLFDVEKITTLAAVPKDSEILSVVRSWDIAATEQQGTNDPDWTVGLKLAKLRDNRFAVLDVRRERYSPQMMVEMIRTTAHEDGTKVRIRLPEDPGAAGKTQASYLVGQLAGFQVDTNRETGSKATRATPVISQCNVGNLMVVAAKWNRGFVSELRDFPNGRKDDQVDALSGAFEIVGIGPQVNQLRADQLSALRARMMGGRG